MVEPALEMHRRFGPKRLGLLLSYYLSKAGFWCVGNGRECPLCGWRGREFVPFLNFSDFVARPKAACPRCGSLERHRAYKFFYEKFFSDPIGKELDQILHFAPEKGLEGVLRSYAKVYVKSNFADPAPDELSLDLRNLTLEDESFDVFVMNRVLSCMPGDVQAVRSMHRVLSDHGVVLAGEAVALDRRTVELERIGYGGLHRLYGILDFEERFYPFRVEVLDITEKFSEAERKRCGLNSPEQMIILRKSQP